MTFNVILVTTRSMTIELMNDSVYYSTEPYQVMINNKIVIEKENKNVVSIYNLEPDSEYTICVKMLESEEVFTCIGKTLYESVRLDVKKFGAVGDGKHLDSMAIQAAISSCPNDGTVLIPKGEYYCSPLFLKSNIYIELEKDAKIIGHKDRNFYPILPGYTTTSNNKDEYYLGTWEGNPLDSFASLITGINVENTSIFGEGVIDGNGSNGDWWDYLRKKNRAWRPRTIFLKGSKNISFQGITVQHSPAWTIHPYLSDHIRFIDLFVSNDAKSPNTDGIDPESCSNVDIIGVFISVGDDCIAIKSGKVYMGKKLKRPTENCIIRNCHMKSGHGAVVFGSEMSGGIKNIEVSKCLFTGTDRGLRIKTRRGRGCDAIIDGIVFDNIEMNKVLTPLVINMYYFCDPDGKSEYVWSKEKLPVDEWTPYLGEFCFKNMTCNDIEVAAGFFAGLPEQHIKKIRLENIKFTFKKEANPGYPAMMSNLDPIKKMGISAMNVQVLELKNVSINGNEGERMYTQNVEMATDS